MHLICDILLDSYLYESFQGNKVLWVSLCILKNDEDGRVVRVIHNRVVDNTRGSGVFRRRCYHVFVSLGELSDQNEATVYVPPILLRLIWDGVI